MSEKTGSDFDIWWNSPSVKRFVGTAYSLGASVVIIGAMFKILHLPGAGIILGIGMTVEAFLFALGAFDKPFKEYEWDKVFNFKSEEQPGVLGASQGAGDGERGIKKVDALKDEDIVSLSDGIKSLSESAQQLNNLTDAIKPMDEFVKNVDGASKVADQYAKLQGLLNASTQKLVTSYDGIGDDVETVVKNTKLYADRVEGINKNLSSVNSLYEIHLKNIHAQSEILGVQSEQFRVFSGELNGVVEDIQKIRSSSKVIAEETEKYKDGTTQLVKQVAALNQVYGNMLNSLS
jgi:gliding motility-associated protein GldL